MSTDPQFKAAAVEILRQDLVSKGMDPELAAKAAAELVEQADQARSSDDH